MTLERVLENEVMDSDEEARDYDGMDHSAVNGQFVDDLLGAGWTGGDVLDLGTGTAQIPVELCHRVEECRVFAVDFSVSMLDLARYNVEAAGLTERIQLAHLDAKDLSLLDAEFGCVMSNSIVHHIREPAIVLEQAVKAAAPGGFVFFRDLLRPSAENELRSLVEKYAGGENAHQQKMFQDSLRAALRLDEIRQLVESIGYDPSHVRLTSDRHWTWSTQLAAETGQDELFA